MSLEKDPMAMAAAIASIMSMLDLTTEAAAEKFEREADAVADVMVSAALAAVTGTVDGDNDEVEVDTYQMAVVSYGADKVSEFLTKQVADAIAKQAPANVLSSIEQTLTGSNAV